jgi:hypothetical protein
MAGASTSGGVRRSGKRPGTSPGGAKLGGARADQGTLTVRHTPAAFPASPTGPTPAVGSTSHQAPPTGDSRRR